MFFENTSYTENLGSMNTLIQYHFRRKHKKYLFTKSCRYKKIKKITSKRIIRLFVNFYGALFLETMVFLKGPVVKKSEI